MAILTDKFNPSFVRWPFQNNRTALQPVNMPLILVVPFVRDPATGAEIPNTACTNLRFFIEEAPGLVPVAGFENAGIFVPNFERFVREVSEEELDDVLIVLDGLQFFDKDTGELKTFTDAQAGDQFEYQLKRGLVAISGPRDRIEFIPGANYYDLSPFLIETAELKPYGPYNFVWQCSYFNRIITPQGELFCVDENDLRLARFRILMAHPGEIHQMMIEQTPSVYFDGAPLDQDTLVKFYRPFADALQDIFDEQKLLVGVNFIEQIPAQFIPYLAYLLGWDLPFFPGSSDRMRRAVLRNGRRLQQLKGSQRAIRELFELFGFAIDIINLWYKRDGTGFVGPGESTSDPAEEIEVQEICQTEVLVTDFAEDGFGNLEIPLLFRPKQTSDITVDAWLVEIGSEAEEQLQSLLGVIDTDPEGLMGSVCPATDTGFLVSQPLVDSVTAPALGQSRILVTQRFGAIDEIRLGDAPLSVHGVKYNFDKNLFEISFDHFIQFRNRSRLYIFATYKRDKIVVPPSLTDLRSNRFDIQLLFDRATQEAPSSQLLDFLLDFIFRLKAFHSILRKIIFPLQVTDVYNVIDFCVGGRVSQAPGTDLGELQTPLAIIPLEPGECNDDAFKRGFKDEDLSLRDEILDALKAEHAAWKALDGTRNIPPSVAPIVESLTRISPNASAEAVYGDPGINYGIAFYGADQQCEFTQHGQERVLAEFGGTNGDQVIKDFDHMVDDRPKLCDDTNNVNDNCFNGRVKQELELDRILLAKERVRCRPCEPMMGLGFYYFLPTFPNEIEQVQYGEALYGRFEYGAEEIDTSTLENLGRGFLTDLIIRATANTNFIHYVGKTGLESDDVFTNDNAGIRRPSLEIDKDNMFFPGHRFVLMNKLEDDFVHSEYFFRPWDDLFDPNRCPETIPEDPYLYGTAPYGSRTYGDLTISIDDLDPQLILDTAGNLVLTFNEIPYKVYGNGLVPDISSMGEHDARSFLVTHKIFSTADEGHEAVSLDDTIEHTSLSTVCFADLYGPIFGSANRECGCSNPSASFVAGETGVSGADFIDGYPSEFDQFAFDITDHDFGRGGSDDIDLIMALNLPLTGSPQPNSLLFKMGSGIRVEEPDLVARFHKPCRLDCMCLFFECELGTGETIPQPVRVDRCNIETFREPDGSLDLNCDRATLLPTMLLPETYGGCSTRMGLFPHSAATGDPTIPNMFCFDAEKVNLSLDEKFPPNGDFFFVDSAGIIHEGMFEISGDRIDITYTTRDPRVWGEEPTGSVEITTSGSKRVFREGIVTTCRQLLEVAGTDTNILATACLQGVDTFQTTFGCGDAKLPTDPFAFHLECGILDDLEFEINLGPSFE